MSWSSTPLTIWHKGFYTLGVLREIEGMVKCPLYEKFDLIFGTSTGAIIAALLALGKSVKEISDLYERYVPSVMQRRGRAEKSAALKKLLSVQLLQKTLEINTQSMDQLRHIL